MRLGIMQPYFFPYLGHFALIAHTDRWIVFDISQYVRRSWINRNRVLHPAAGWNYVTVPLAHSSTSLRISEARIARPRDIGRSVAGKLAHYRRKAPYYEAVQALVSDAFRDTPESLVDLNVRALQLVCRYLDIPVHLAVCSRMELRLPQHMDPGLWALEICTQVGADQYLNPMGGRALFDPAQFAARGVELQFMEGPEFRYETRPYAFEPDLSILDVLMWNSPQTVTAAIWSGARRVSAPG